MSESEEENARVGHNQPCYYCGEPTNLYAGDPGRWPLPFCHSDEPGVVKWHHTSCVTDRLTDKDVRGRTELDEWRQAAEVEASLRREFQNEVGRLRTAFRVNALRWGFTDDEINAVLDPPS